MPPNKRKHKLSHTLAPPIYWKLPVPTKVEPVLRNDLRGFSDESISHVKSFLTYINVLAEWKKSTKFEKLPENYYINIEINNGSNIDITITYLRKKNIKYTINAQCNYPPYSIDEKAYCNKYNGVKSYTEYPLGIVEYNKLYKSSDSSSPFYYMECMMVKNMSMYINKENLCELIFEGGVDENIVQKITAIKDFFNMDTIEIPPFIEVVENNSSIITTPQHVKMTYPYHVNESLHPDSNLTTNVSYWPSDELFHYNVRISDFDNIREYAEMLIQHDKYNSDHMKAICAFFGIKDSLGVDAIITLLDATNFNREDMLAICNIFENVTDKSLQDLYDNFKTRAMDTLMNQNDFDRNDMLSICDVFHSMSLSPEQEVDSYCKKAVKRLWDKKNYNNKDFLAICDLYKNDKSVCINAMEILMGKKDYNNDDAEAICKVFKNDGDICKKAVNNIENVKN